MYIRMVSKRVTENDESFIRPLFMEFSDSAVFDISSQFMFGPSIMVCPVTKSMIDFEKYKSCEIAYKCEPVVELYLPADCDWYDWWSGKKYNGGQWIKVDAPIEKLPLFVRADSKVLVERNGEIKEAICRAF